MTNHLVGDVYQKIIEEVVAASANDFEESGVSGTTLHELQQEWQAKLSQRGVAQMPWDPKPAPPPPAPAPNTASGLPSAANGVQPQYGYNGQQQSNGANGVPHIKSEPGADQQWSGMPNGYPQGSAPPPQGGLARAQQLVQQYGGQPANPSPNPMQQRGGLALPGQQARPQGLQLPGQSAPPPQQYTAQQQQQMLQQRQQQQQQAQHQQQLQQQQAQPRIKVENNTPQLDANAFPQASNPPNPPNPAYAQTDGADDDLEEWKAMLAQRRAAGAEALQRADGMMRDQVMQISQDLQSGLMVPLDEQSTRRNKLKRKVRSTNTNATAGGLPSIPQLDGDADDDDEKADVKDDDDENAINSDLDDSDDDGQGNMGDDDDDLGDSILCTYDKVQRVKNKWKCTLKDGVMSVGGKEWVFHKGTGEYEW